MDAFKMIGDCFTEDVKSAVDALAASSATPTIFSLRTLGNLGPIFAPGCEPLPQEPRPPDTASPRKPEVEVVFDKQCVDAEPGWVQDIIGGIVRDFLMTERTTITDTEMIVHLAVPARLQALLRKIRSGVRSSLKLLVLQLVGKSRSIVQVDLEHMVFQASDDLPSLVGALCQGLRFNHAVTDLSLARQPIGAAGFQHLADMLLLNGSLQHLNLRGTNMLPGHLGLVASALERNISLSMTLSSLLLGDNPGLLAGGGDGSHVLRRILDVSKSLERLDLSNTGADPEAIYDIAWALSSSTSLKSLVLARNVMGRQDFKVLAAMLAVNRSLEELNFSACGMVAEDLAVVSSALLHNDGQRLKVWVLGRNPDLLAHGDGQPVSQLLGVVSGLQELDLSETGLNKRGQTLAMISLALKANSSLRKLNLGGNRVFRDDGGKYLGDMLRLNSGLQELGLSCCTSGAGAWRDDESMDALAAGLAHNSSLKRLDFSLNVPRLQLLESLGDNKSLTCLNLELCDFDRSASVQAILAMLDRNISLKSLRLDKCTGLEDTDLARIRLQLESNAASASTKQLLLSLHSAKPKFARVFLCGAPYAGKTALRVSAFEARRLENLSHVRSMMLQVRKLSGFLRKNGWARRMRWGDRKAALERTSGVEIQMLEDEPGTSVAVWDVAGHEENPSFHENLLASCRAVGTTAAFVIVCNLCRKQDGQVIEALKSAADVVDECEFWLKLLASSTRQRARGSAIRPRVFVVLNRKSSWRKRSSRALTDATSTSLAKLRKQFESYLDIVLREKDAVEVLDVCSASAVSPFFESVLKSTREVAAEPRQPQVPSAAEDLSIAIAKWMLRHSSRPIISWHKFQKLCHVSGIEELSSFSSSKDENAAEVQERCRAVASFMHDAGQIIFFQELQVVVISPRWFCHCFLGRLISAGSTIDQGLATGRILHNVFSESLDELSKRKQDKLRVILPDAKLIQLMLRLELCFESGTGRDSKLYCVPAALPLDDDAECGSRRLQWPLKPHSELDRPLGHLGRRLACRDQVCTFLTPGFFPRLQVHLYNRFSKLCGFERAMYRVERNLISVSHWGVDYLIEYSPFDYFVDILVRHPVDSSETLAHVQQNVIGPIQEFCASRGGCQGVDLVEGVIRTSSVERLDLCQDRRNQSAPLSDLVLELEVHGSEHRHRWPKDAEGREDSEYIVLLLGKEDLQSQGDKWSKGLEHAALELGLDSIKQQDSTRTELDNEHDNVRGLSADLRDTLSRMPESESRALSSITRRIDRMKGWQERILEHMSSRLNELNPFTVQLQERQLPKLAYFTVTELTGVTETRQIVAEMSSWLTAGVQVHYMCEAQLEGKPHIVPKQPGRHVSLTPESLKPWWPYLAGAMSVLDVMVKAGAEKLISSPSIPTFSSRPYWKDKLFWDGVGKPGKSAPQWLVDFFTGPGPQRIYDDFMLHKVRYEQSQQVAWICDDHMRRGKECGILKFLPA